MRPYATYIFFNINERHCSIYSVIDNRHSYSHSTFIFNYGLYLGVQFSRKLTQRVRLYVFANYVYHWIEK